MAQVAPSPADAALVRRSRRWWFLVVVDALAVLGIVAVWFLLPEQYDRGMRITLTVPIVALALAAWLVWFFFMARLPARVRWVGVAVLVALGVTAVGSVRRVEFSGDMTPTFDFRWSADRYAVLEAHRAGQRAGPTKTAARENEAKPQVARPADWDVLEYRGANRDGVVAGPELARDWSANPPKLVWRQPVGGGYASFVVIGPLVATIEQRRDKEAIVAYDFDSGREIWTYDYPALFHEALGGDGPRATPTVRDGRLYSLGATGVLVCLELAAGKPLWSLNILEQNGAANLDWAMAGSPLVYDNLVLVNPGNQKGTSKSRSITTFDAATGKPLWGGGETKAGYASPMLATLAGVRQILIFDAAGLAGFDAADGRELWRTPWTSDFDINAAQPVVLDDDRVFISSAAGAALYKIALINQRWTVDEVWKNRKMKCGYSCPIARQGYVYGMDENILACVHLADGKQMWKDRAGQYGHGQMLLAGDLLVVLGEAGELALVEPTPQRFHELGRIQAIDGKTWNNPALVGNRVFVRNHLEMAAYDLPLAP
jgi:outer membrane protein assembly factor BamB